MLQALCVSAADGVVRTIFRSGSATERQRQCCSWLEDVHRCSGVGSHGVVKTMVQDRFIAREASWATLLAISFVPDCCLAGWTWPPSHTDSTHRKLLLGSPLAHQLGRLASLVQGPHDASLPDSSGVHKVIIMDLEHAAFGCAGARSLNHFQGKAGFAAGLQASMLCVCVCS